MMCFPKIKPGSLTKFFEVNRRAREIDPEAFKPLMIPHYTNAQIARQGIAQAKAHEELEATNAKDQA